MGDYVEPIKDSLEGNRQKQVEDVFGTVVENYLVPSHALLLHAYWSYLTDSVPMRALRSVEKFAGNIRCRGSREMMLAILMIAGMNHGKDLALDIMKLREEKGLPETLNALWNTSSDLTYTRLAVSTPLSGRLPEPVVFVTADKHLGTFVNTIEPKGGGGVSNGAVLPLDLGHFEGLLSEEYNEGIQRLMLASAKATAENAMPMEHVARMRRVNSAKCVERLEADFSTRYSA